MYIYTYTCIIYRVNPNPQPRSHLVVMPVGAHNVGAVRSGVVGLIRYIYIYVIYIYIHTYIHRYIYVCNNYLYFYINLLHVHFSYKYDIKMLYS